MHPIVKRIGIKITRIIYKIFYSWENVLPQLKYQRVVSDFVIFNCLNVVLKLHIVEHLLNGPKNIEELSELTQSKQDYLYRVLRALAIEGFFSYNEKTQLFSNNKCSLLLDGSPVEKLKNDLKNDDVDSLEKYQNSINESKSTQTQPFNISCFVTMFQHPGFFDSIRAIPECVVQGKSGFNINNGISLFEHFEHDAFFKKVFDSTMKQKNDFLETNIQILDCFDFSQYSKICDIGGGVGNFSYELLNRHQKSIENITVLDVEKTITNGLILANADNIKKELLEKEKIKFHVGDMFVSETIPDNCNLYTLMQVIHDWGTDDAIKTLKSIGTVMKRNTNKPKLVIIDAVCDDNMDTTFHNKSHVLSDMIMMSVVGGVERTKSQWDHLFKESNLKLISTKRFSVPSFLSVMELELIQ